MHPYEHTDSYWNGRFSMAVALSLRKIEQRPKEARQDLSRTLHEYLRSPVASPELRAQLREEIR